MRYIYHPGLGIHESFDLLSRLEVQALIFVMKPGIHKPRESYLEELPMSMRLEYGLDDANSASRYFLSSQLTS